MPPNTVKVDRSTIWGNPFPVGPEFPTAEKAVAAFRVSVTPIARTIRSELAGKNLACWCPLDKPCHADVLLELANN